MKIKAPISLLFISVLFIQIVYWSVVFVLFEDDQARGLFGDSFGGLTSLFSGLAFAGMIYAIILQSRELALQREELQLTRQELRASRSEQKKSAQAQEKLATQQLLTARINGLSAIVQGRYQYASSYGSNANQKLSQVLPAEELLLELLNEVSDKKIDLPTP